MDQTHPTAQPVRRPISIKIREYFRNHLVDFAVIFLYLLALAILVCVLVWIVLTFGHKEKVTLWCNPNVTVSLDGGDSFSSITGAIQSAPNYNPYKYCIHIKSGYYVENVIVPSDKTNIVFIGDGMDKTIIVANRSCNGHFCEPQVPTLWIEGNAFIAVDLAVLNKEVPVSLPALAVKSWSDRSIFYRCRLEGLHGVVYLVEGRQFYRECQVHGSGTLVSDVSRAFFQGCLITIDMTTSGSSNVVAVEATDSPGATRSGFAFHHYTISAEGRGLSDVPPLLGAPLAAYAFIVYMECDISVQVGWSHGNFAPGTIFYGEYGNTGIGATYSIQSPDVHRLERSEASKYILRRFFPEYWLPESDIPVTLDLET